MSSAEAIGRAVAGEHPIALNAIYLEEIQILLNVIYFYDFINNGEASLVYFPSQTISRLIDFALTFCQTCGLPRRRPRFGEEIAFQARGPSPDPIPCSDSLRCSPH